MLRRAQAIFAGVLFLAIIAWEVLSHYSVLDWIVETLRTFGPTGATVASLLMSEKFRLLLCIVGLVLVARSLAGDPQGAPRGKKARLKKTCIELSQEIFRFVDDRRSGEPSPAVAGKPSRGAEAIEIFRRRFSTQLNALVQELRRTGYLDQARRLGEELLYTVNLPRIENLAATIRAISEQIK